MDTSLFFTFNGDSSMKVKKSLYKSIASVMLAGVISVPAIATPYNLSQNQTNVFAQTANGTSFESQNYSPEVEINKLSEQGKIKSAQLIVKFKSISTPATTSSILSKFSIKAIKDFYKPAKLLASHNELFSKMKVISFNKGTNIGKAFKDLLDEPSVEYVAPNHVFQLQATTPNDLNNNLWGLNNTGQSRTFADSNTGESRTEIGTANADINAPEAWDIRHDATNTIVAVIDTGIDYTHSELASNMWTNPGEIAGNGIDDDGNGYIDDIHGYDFADNDSDPMDVHGHGTHCSGTIGAQGDNGNNITGVAWNTQLMALKVFGDGANGAYTTDIVNAIVYAADMGAKVSNNSYGSYFGDSVLANLIYKPMYDAISAANDAGMLFVAAAGNNQANLDSNFMHTPSDLELPNIISVAASNQDDEPASWFTNFGKTSVDIAAPGEFIYSTLPGDEYATWNGTSMAAPHVAGVATLLSEENPELTPAEIKAVIVNSADKIDALTDTTISGGRLNAEKSLIAVQSNSSECQSFTSSNDQHVAAGRATKTTTWFISTYKAVGTNESIGSYGYTTTTLYENEAGIFSKIEDCQISGAIDAPPVLTLNGDRDKYIFVGSNYSLPPIPATAFDREDGDITGSITATGSFDTQTPGRYIITYKATDSAGNDAVPVSRYIHVTDIDDKPVIELFGTLCNMFWCEAMDMEKNTPYIEPGYIAYDLVDGDLTDEVFTTGDSMDDTSEVGVRSLSYHVTDNTGNQTTAGSYRLIAVLDTEMPHIMVRPPNWRSPVEFNSYANDFYTWKRADDSTDWRYAANYAIFDLKTDFYDEKQVTWDDNVSVTGENAVDYTTAGTYTVDFSATDTDGNTSTAQQRIHVLVDITAPVVELFGENTVTVEIGDKYIEPGGVLTDDLDLFPRAYIKYYDAAGNEIENPFGSHITEEASYTIEYYGHDGAGNQATPKFRTVNVVRSHWNHAPIFTSYNQTNFENAIIHGTAYDVDGDLDRVEIEFNGDGNWNTITGSSNWSYIADFYGRREYLLRAIDVNGNITMLDKNPKIIISSTPVIIESHSVLVNGSSVVISGTASDQEDNIEKIIVAVDGGEFVQCEGTTTWSCTFEGLSYGQHSYEIRSKDEWRFYFHGTTYFDIAPAKPQIDSYEYSFDGNSLVVTGTASDMDDDILGVHLLIGLGGVNCSGITSFTCVLPDLVDGTAYEVALEVRDNYGNASDLIIISFTFEAAGECITNTNYSHVQAGRAYVGGISNLYAYAEGSGDELGLYGSSYYSTTTSLEETSAGVWTKVTSCN